MQFLKHFIPLLILLIILISSFAALLMSYPTQGQRIAEHALEYLDVPYVLSRKDPKAFDCSGFLLYLFADEGITLPHSAELIGTDESYPLIADKKDLRIGDIVCFDTVEDRDPSDHVGIYLGKKRFVHASSTYGKVVISKIEDIYLDTFTGGRRIADVDLSFSERLNLLLDSVHKSRQSSEDCI